MLFESSFNQSTAADEAVFRDQAGADGLFHASIIARAYADAMDSLVMDTPVGRIRLLADRESLVAIERTAAKTSAQTATSPVLRAARNQLREYFEGRRASFDLSLAPAATPFQQKVREALLRIPFAKTATYAEIAKAIGTKSPRAVGQAVGSNPLLVIVPCHRIVASGGGIGGFAWGLRVKKRLLSHEKS